MKRNLLFFCIIFLCTYKPFAQTVGIGTSAPDTSAALDVTHAAKGLLIPRMITNSVLAIPKPAKGLLVFDSLANQLMVNLGSPTSPTGNQLQLVLLRGHLLEIQASIQVCNLLVLPTASRFDSE